MLILLVEDHRPLAQTLIDFLECESMDVDYAADGLQGLELATTQPYDAIILDINLPGIDGLQICERLRRQEAIDTPILMLTARDQLDDKMSGFAAGADDYLIKPFEQPELMMRLQALIKRHRGEVVDKTMRVGDLELDIGRKVVSRGGQALDVSPTGMRILRILMRESPEVVSRQDLERELWGNDVPDSDVLRSHIYNLRKAIDHPFDNAMLRTVKGVGLKLVSADA